MHIHVRCIHSSTTHPNLQRVVLVGRNFERFGHPAADVVAAAFAVVVGVLDIDLAGVVVDGVVAAPTCPKSHCVPWRQLAVRRQSPTRNLQSRALKEVQDARQRDWLPQRPPEKVHHHRYHYYYYQITYPNDRPIHWTRHVKEVPGEEELE